MTYTTTDSAIRELDRRSSDGIDVRLMWNQVTNEVMLAVYDSRTEVSFELQVSGPDALDAFRHPFAYTTRRRTDGVLTA